jgi:hypothetical protein
MNDVRPTSSSVYFADLSHDDDFLYVRGSSFDIYSSFSSSFTVVVS